MHNTQGFDPHYDPGPGHVTAMIIGDIRTNMAASRTRGQQTPQQATTLDAGWL